MIKLFEGEKIVSQSEHRLVELTLTTHRICYEYSVWGNSYNQNIGLEHITSCENKYASNIVFAIISVVSFILGFLIGTEISIGIGFFLFVFFAIIYALTKQNNIFVGPATAADAANPTSAYNLAHNAATPQNMTITQRAYDASGNEVFQPYPKTTVKA